MTMSDLMPQPTQRVGPLARLPSILAGRGLSLAGILDGLDLTESDLRPETFLPIRVISSILDRAALKPGLEEIGLLLASGQNQAVLGPIGQLMMSCETLGDALGTFSSLQMANSTAAAAYFHRLGEDYALGFGVYASELPSSHIYDISIAVGLNIIRDLTAGAIAPHEVLISRPVSHNPKAYRKYFNCEVRFNESQSCLILPGHAAGYKLLTANAAVRESLLNVLQVQMARQTDVFATRVRHALYPLIVQGMASYARVAAHLNLHPRTLSRRLAKEDISFEHLKDEVRRAIARKLLARTDVAVSDIAASLGYAGPSAFVRAFRRWEGSPPSVWRHRTRELNDLL